MNTIVYALFVLLFCTFSSTEDVSLPTTIGAGQMPATTCDNKGVVHIVYGSGDSLIYSSSTDKGHTFCKPQLIAIVEDLAASATRGPKITTTQSGVAVVAATKGGDIWSYTKTSGSKWVHGNRINDVDSVNLEGFVDVASDGGANVFAAWLDLRGTRRNKLYGARSADGGKTWSRNIKVYESPDSTICECCRISVAMKERNVYVMFRNQLYGYRDLHLVSSNDRGKTFGKPEKLGTGTWKLNGCPMDGGSMSVASDGTIHTVWRRESKIYECVPGNREEEIGEGKSCTIENINGKDVFAWIKNGEVICKLSDGSIKNLGKGNSPRLQVIDRNKFLCIWENENIIYSSTISL